MAVAVPSSVKGYELLHKGSIMLAEIEHNGIRVDVGRLRAEIHNTEEKQIRIAESLKKDPIFLKWKLRFGNKTNLDADQQLATVLFKDMKFQHQGFTEKDPSRFLSDEASLKSTGLPFVDKYIEWKQLGKLQSTYLKGILKEVAGGFLHPMFGLALARTYRSQCSRPNFQNIPIRNPEIGKIIRSCFIPRTKDYQIVEFDYSGIEVRIAYCYHRDPVMRKYLLDPTKDMHKDMAVECYKLHEYQKDQTYWKNSDKGMGKTVRYCGKNMYVFPEFYGDSYVNCAASLWEACTKMDLRTPDGKSMIEHLKSVGITSRGKCDHKDRDPEVGTFEAHMKKVEHAFWNKRFKVYNQWKQDWWNAYLETASFTTHTGFQYYGTMSRNQCINWPVQGSAFHCLLWSMIEVQKELKRRKMKTKLMAQIHDSMIADVHRKELDDYMNLVKEITTKSLLKAWDWIIIPMEVEAEVSPIGGTWYDKQPYKWSVAT